jgi:hypothetical protein
MLDRFCPLGYLMFASCATALVWVCALLRAMPAR